MPAGNNFNLIGNLTNDPDKKDFEENSVVDFNLAFNHKKDDVSYFECQAWGKTGDNILQYCKKGSQIAITGYIKQQRWASQDGTNRSKVKLVVENVKFLFKIDAESKSENSNNSSPTTQYADDDERF